MKKNRLPISGTQRLAKKETKRPEGEEAEVLKYGNIEYAVEEDVPGRWRYIIYPKMGTSARVYGDAKHGTREAAVEAAFYEIDNGLERSRRKPPD